MYDKIETTFYPVHIIAPFRNTLQNVTANVREDPPATVDFLCRIGVTLTLVSVGRLLILRGLLHREAHSSSG